MKLALYTYMVQRASPAEQPEFSKQEIKALFVRCLTSQDSDSPEIVAALRKLGKLLETDGVRIVAC